MPATKQVTKELAVLELTSVGTVRTEPTADR